MWPRNQQLLGKKRCFTVTIAANLINMIMINEKLSLLSSVQNSVEDLQFTKICLFRHFPSFLFHCTPHSIEFSSSSRFNISVVSSLSQFAILSVRAKPLFGFLFLNCFLCSIFLDEPLLFYVLVVNPCFKWSKSHLKLF